MEGIETAAAHTALSDGKSEAAPSFSWNESVGAVPLACGWDAEPCVVDWDGTGRPALLVSSGGGSSERSSRLYRPLGPPAPGSLPVYDSGTLLPELGGLRCVCSLPNGQPNRFDLVALSPAGLVHLPNSGTPQEPRFLSRVGLDLGPNLGIDHAHVVQLAAVDWDSDGLIDLLAGIHDLERYWPDAGKLPRTQVVGLNQRAGHPGYDRQGLWRGRAPVARVFWLRNVGRPGEPRFELQPEIRGESGPLDLGLRPAPLAVSWGGRGNLELLASDERGLLRVYRNFGGQRPPVLMEPRTLECARAPVLLHDDRTVLACGDLDGDQNTEIVYGTASGGLYWVHDGPTRNDATNPAPVSHQPDRMLLGGHSSMVIGDLDADGDLDIVYGDAVGRLHYLEDQGDGDEHRYAPPIVIEAGGAPFRIEPGPDGMLLGPAEPALGYARPAIADWLDHGRPDLLVAGAGGDVLLLPNDGGATEPRFGHPVAIRCQGHPLILPPRVQPAVASWSDPEGLDLIALDLQGFLCAYPQVERNEVGPPVFLVDHLGRVIRLDGGFGLSGRCSIWAGPWTAPGKIDLLIGLPRCNRHVIPAATGRPLEDVAALPTVLLLENQGQGVVVPRPLMYGDGTPVVIGQDGCRPQGVRRRNAALPDLLIAGDEGGLTWIDRENLRW